MKILIIDDHQLYLEGVKALISQLFPESDLLSAYQITDALSLLSSHHDIDLILLDLNIPNGGAPAILNKLHQHNYIIPVLIVSASDNSADVKMMIKQGASGYLPKSSPPIELEKAIQAIFLGNEYFPDNWQELLQKKNNITVLDGDISISISPRLHDVLQLIEKGYTSPEISRLLVLSEHTVKGYIKDLFSRFHVHNRTELVQMARQLHFFSLQQ